MEQSYTHLHFHLNSLEFEVKNITKLKEEFAEINNYSKVFDVLDKVKFSPKKKTIDKILEFANAS